MSANSEISPELEENSKKLTVLVCSTGSVATIKLPEILTRLCDLLNNVHLDVVLTEKAKHFCQLDSLVKPNVRIYSDSEWNMEKEPNLCEELSQRANILLIAPLDANTLAKIANGLCDNLLTSVIRSWDFNNKIALCCPAMNTQMWIHPITNVHIKQLETFGFNIIPPVTKKLACGDYGVGAMAEPVTLVSEVARYAEFNGNKRIYATQKNTAV
ncbi:hypothetical protein O3M35_010872 [Rhynocoris fuscipes]|uniref:Flavoprotein domain-containing protein n=1 Tax=Rhynocoris fuscipes TaxID=488301 RepID=A0AAW1D7N5_9HEMI